MFRYAFMTCRLHVINMFEKMTIMVRHGQVKYLINFGMNCFYLILFIIMESIIGLWEVFWRLTQNLGSKFGTAPSELNNLGHNHYLVGLCMKLEALNHMEALVCMQLGAYVTEKSFQLRVWALGVVVWLLGVLQLPRKVRKV